MKVKEEELAKAKSVSNSVSQLIQYNAKSDPSFIDQMQAKLRKDNKDQFALLVQQAKASKGKRNVNKEVIENIQTVNLTQQNQVQLTPKRKIAEDENEEELQEVMKKYKACVAAFSTDQITIQVNIQALNASCKTIVLCRRLLCSCFQIILFFIFRTSP